MILRLAPTLMGWQFLQGTDTKANRWYTMHMDTTGSKLFRCNRCKEFKVESAFSNNRSRSTGKADRCRPCAVKVTAEWQRNNPEKVAARNKRWKDAHPEQVIKYGSFQSRRRREFLKQTDPDLVVRRERSSTCKKRGVTSEWYDKQLKEQHGKCAICERVDNYSRLSFAIDHDHKCCDRKSGCEKCVRGLLCTICNATLHKLEASGDWINRAVAYLNTYAQRQTTNT
jgi:Pyruvate/2-oxoacid:ferredoxin oxidoreductase delta subunit